MNSKFLGCSKQRALSITQKVMQDLNLRITGIEKAESRIYAERSWRFLSAPQTVEVTVFSHPERVEVVTSVSTRFPILDFGNSDWLEEELLYRVAEEAENERRKGA
jgi:hypothetical protein